MRMKRLYPSPIYAYHRTCACETNRSKANRVWAEKVLRQVRNSSAPVCSPYKTSRQLNKKVFQTPKQRAFRYKPIHAGKPNHSLSVDSWKLPFLKSELKVNK